MFTIYFKGKPIDGKNSCSRGRNFILNRPQIQYFLPFNDKNSKSYIITFFSHSLLEDWEKYVGALAMTRASCRIDINLLRSQSIYLMVSNEREVWRTGLDSQCLVSDGEREIAASVVKNSIRNSMRSKGNSTQQKWIFFLHKKESEKHIDWCLLSEKIWFARWSIHFSCYFLGNDVLSKQPHRSLREVIQAMQAEFSQ